MNKHESFDGIGGGFSKTLHKITWVPLKHLSVVWSEAQRGYDEKWAASLAQNFDPDLFGVIIVTTANRQGVHHVVEGQHRCGAVRMAFGESEKVPCIILDTEDPARAAEIFDKINSGRKSLSALDKFRVRVTAGYEIPVAVNEIVESEGYRVGSSVSDGVIRAAGALTTVYSKHGGEVLRQTLRTIRATWGDDANAMDGSIIAGYGALLAEHGSKIDNRRLVERMEKRFTPGRLRGAVKATREVQHGTTANVLKQVIINTYNQGLRSGRIGNE